ncbi:MAG: hypothetical protein CMK59_05610 [Proteobacteria bacterium]|nr:hypothetical protein [Pseudomonadota bacterium]
MSVMLLNLGLIYAGAVLFWLLSIPLRNVAIADVYWGLIFVLLAWSSFVQNEYTQRGLLLAVLVSVWGGRLAVYLMLRGMGQPEDRRYRAMRDIRGDSFWWRSFYVVFGLQAGLGFLIGIPLQMKMAQTDLMWLDVVGVSLWCFGCFWEFVGDWQLSRFLKNRKDNDVLSSGLWKYTRHPNYFGEACLWVGLECIALAGGAPWWTICSPMLMIFLLLRVSGVTMMEKTIVSRRPNYQAYIERTPSFFPWFPRS